MTYRESTTETGAKRPPPLKIGIMPLPEFKARTIAIAKGEYKPGPDEPKIWFPSFASFAKLLFKIDRQS